ncbi:hypothetical protein [Frondihabitans sp. PAMC 28766]|uniref:hypothetical protein n=1 Tax=Frondihabitans sp. PAMC 28766 TaxID=1795630 RepID=UPI0012FFC7FB|nr:hypothetical protein [Frondihabitans sp. PAMC 28766]
MVGLTDAGDAVTKSFEFTRFRQQLRTRPQRQLLGIDMSQDDALRLLGDEAALRVEYRAWLRRKGLPEPVCDDAGTGALQTPKRTLWNRLTGR